MRIIDCTIKNNAVFENRTCEFEDGNPEEWRGITVFGGFSSEGKPDPEILPLLGKLRELADKTDDKSQILLIGEGLVENARDLFSYGADRVFVYDDPLLKNYDEEKFADILIHFIDNYKPAAIYFVKAPGEKDLFNRTIDHAVKAMPFSGEKNTVEKAPVPYRAESGRRGELVICEIPRFV